MTIIKAACVQMCSGTAINQNLRVASELIRSAAEAGASLIATPEMTTLLDIRPGKAGPQHRYEADNRELAAFRDLAAELKIWLSIGSIGVRHEEEERSANRSFLIGPHGQLLARYDKIHMFDVEIDDGQQYCESRAYRPGQAAVLVETPFAKIGMTICYDLRFPSLYRQLSQSGADIITCPAAFTRLTGEAHWHALLRARAIENGVFILAAAQGGDHADGRQTFGHSLIVSPWGEVLAEAAGTAPGVIFADLDLTRVAAVRRQIPSLSASPSVPLVVVRDDTTIE